MSNFTLQPFVVSACHPSPGPGQPAGAGRDKAVVCVCVCATTSTTINTTTIITAAAITTTLPSTPELPFGWERQITEDGKVFFVDHINHKTTYTDPRLAFAVEESRTLGDLRQRFDSSTTGIQVRSG